MTSNPTIQIRYVLLFCLTLAAVFTVIGLAMPAEAPKACPVNGSCPIPKSEPTPAATPAPTPPTITTLAAALEVARQAYDKATAIVTSDQATLTKDIAAQAGAKIERDKAKAALQAAIDALDPQPTPAPPMPPPDPTPKPPPPTPPTPPPIAIVEVGRSTGCPACDAMVGVVKQLTDAGVKVDRIDVDKDPAAQEKWRPILLPSWLMMIDGKEVSRTTGTMTIAQFRQWIADTEAWNKNRGVKP